MKVKKVSVPNESELNRFMPADYADCYECVFESGDNIIPARIMAAFWTDFPGWVKFMFKVRNVLVKPFGLDSPIDSIDVFRDAILNSRSFKDGAFPVSTGSEQIMTINDKHLRFFLSVMVTPLDGTAKRLTTATLVNFNNGFGRLYFAVIYPFHGIIVRSMLKHSLRKYGAV